jgi:1-acyl-sn-glycerol-3-phosphate acyltransferase
MISVQLSKKSKLYDHQALENRRRILRGLIKNFVIRFMVKFDHVQGLENLPAKEPAILMINHIAFFDPIVVMNITPRNIVPVAKAEGLNNPIFGAFLRLWEVIPVNRETIDREALRRMSEVLAAGQIILMAPEGTRSPSLQLAKEGIAYVASRNNVPVIPIAIDGTEGFPTLSLRRWRQPGATVCIGRPFYFNPLPHKPDAKQLRKMTDEAMYVLAKMLPADRRGVYANLDFATTDTIAFL